MTSQELKKCNRRELLQLLLQETEENERLRRELEAANTKLAERQVMIESSGSLAEAVVKLNGVFEAADAAAQQYLENVKAKADAAANADAEE